MPRFNPLHHPVLLTGKQKLRRQKASSSGLAQLGLSNVFPLNHHCPHFLVSLSCLTKITSEHHLKHRNRPGLQPEVVLSTSQSCPLLSLHKPPSSCNLLGLSLAQGQSVGPGLTLKIFHDVALLCLSSLFSILHPISPLRSPSGTPGNSLPLPFGSHLS